MDLQPLSEPTHVQQLPLRYFISDLHLDGTDTPRAEKFRFFLKKLSESAQSGPVELYIVGDLFEFWYEYRKQLFEIYARDLEAMEAAAKSGVRIFLFFGNRDFSYGQYVIKRLNATVLGDGAVLKLNDARKVWVEHGDLLCTEDTRYLKFRKTIRGPWVRLMFRLMPWSMAKRQIEKIRARTMADKKSKEKDVFGIDLAEARKRLETERCNLLICGHTHEHQTEDLGAGLRLIVLPAWCKDAGGYVNDGLTFRSFEV